MNALSNTYHKMAFTLLKLLTLLLLTLIASMNSYAQSQLINELTEGSTVISTSTGITEEQDTFNSTKYSDFPFYSSGSPPTLLHTNFSITIVGKEAYSLTPVFGFESTELYHENAQTSYPTNFYESNSNHFRLGLFGYFNQDIKYLFDITYTDSEYTSSQAYSLTLAFAFPYDLAVETGLSYTNQSYDSIIRSYSHSDTFTAFGTIQYKITNQFDISTKVSFTHYQDSYYVDATRLLAASLQADAIYNSVYQQQLVQAEQVDLELAEEEAREAVEDSLGDFGLAILDSENGTTIISTPNTALETKPTTSLSTTINYSVNPKIKLGLSFSYINRSHTDNDISNISGSTPNEQSKSKERSTFLIASYKFF